MPKGKGRPRKSSNYAIPAGSPVGGKGNAKYPIDTMKRARNAIARVQQYGTPAEKKKVYDAVKKKYPGLAKRSGVIPTRSGSGRRIGQPPKGKGGGSSTAGTVRRKKSRRKG